MFMVKTTISLEQSTRDVLRDKAKKSESYDDIILKLMALAEKTKEYDRLREEEAERNG